MSKNGEKLRQLIETVDLGPEEALIVWNEGQAVPLFIGSWLSYMIKPTEPAGIRATSSWKLIYVYKCG